jgi:hypothetical protein
MFLLNSYLQVYSATSLVLSTRSINKLYLYNGRFLHERAVWDSAKNLGIVCELFETVRDRYVLDSNGFHDRVNNQNKMLKHWINSSLSKQTKIEIGSRYFQNLESNLNKFYEERGKALKTKKEFFVYFSSSNDEYAGLGKNWNKTLGEQVDCIKKLQKIFSYQNKYELVVRIHPNLKNKAPEEINLWRSIRNDRNSRVIREVSNVSSYKLLNDAIGVITFGSTIGLEASFRHKPCLVLADCGYDLLGVCDKASDWVDVLNWLKKGHRKSNKVLINRSINSCIRGYYLATGGEQLLHSHVKQTGGSGAWDATIFCGIKIQDRKIIYFYRKMIYKIKLTIFLIRFNIPM